MTDGLPAVGECRGTVVCREVTRTQIVQYAGASGDFSPLHTDELAAIAAGNPSIMAHGMLTMALSAQAVTDWFGAESLLTLDARFTAPVWPGDSLTTVVTVESVDCQDAQQIVRVGLRTANQDGVVTLTGTAQILIDTDSKSK